MVRARMVVWAFASFLGMWGMFGGPVNAQERQQDPLMGEGNRVESPLVGAAVPPAPWEAGGTGSALSCARAHRPEALSTPINPRLLDGRAIEHAVRAEINHQRCIVGLEPVGGSDPLSLAATRRAIEDAAGPAAPDASSAAARAEAAGFTAFAGQVEASPSWLDVPDEGAVADPALGRCGYRDAQGAVIGAPMVARFAEIVVKGWLDDPQAVAVVLAPEARFIGTGVAFGPAVPPCGGIHTVVIAAG